MTDARAHRASGAFTLIELLAVVVIFGLLAGIALPNLGIRVSRSLDAESRQLAATLEFARQRAVMTGIPHQVVVDIDRDAYWLEWFASEAEQFGEEDDEAPPAPPATAPGDAAEIALAAPQAELRSFRPLAGSFGNVTELDRDVDLVLVETPAGIYEDGRLEIRFERDGTSEPTWIELGTEDGGTRTLQLLPLADTVRFGRDEG
jgi:type II secretion system protein H